MRERQERYVWWNFVYVREYGHVWCLDICILEHYNHYSSFFFLQKQNVAWVDQHQHLLMSTAMVSCCWRCLLEKGPQTACSKKTFAFITMWRWHSQIKLWGLLILNYHQNVKMCQVWWPIKLRPDQEALIGLKSAWLQFSISGSNVQLNHQEEEWT